MKLSGNGKGKQYLQSKFKKGKQICRVCGRTNDWDCRITEDEGLAYCSFTPNDSGKKDTHGRYEHILKSDSKNKRDMNGAKNETTKADADKLDAVYSALLEGLELKEKHSNELLYRRKLSDTDIVKNLYYSVPNYNKRLEIPYNLAKQFDLTGVPGFYLNGKLWCLNTTFSGFYIPYRDEKGRIVGLQIRRDEDVEEKYMWLSSNNKLKGASSGAPLHFVNVNLAEEKKEVFLTEGALKADIIGSILGVSVIASAGVTAVNPDNLLNKIFEVFPDLERIVVAYDMDWTEKEEVRMALSRLLIALKGADVEVLVATWEKALGKGLDDVLVIEDYSEDAVKYVSTEEFQGLFASLVIEEEAKESTEEVLVVEPIKETLQEDFKETELNLSEESQDSSVEESENNLIMLSCGDFLDLELEDEDKVVFGLVRGNVGLMVASTNLGKSTLSLNLALSATAGEEFYPLLSERHSAQKILYIDGEATKEQLQTDIKKMMEVFTPSQVESVKKNLFLICDEELDDEPLDLVNPDHQKVIKEKALACEPDLIIVDTLSALMDMEDENDNAKVKKEVIKPLKKLARQTNSAVLLLHHTGKFNEGFSKANKAYNGRGASAFGALSRSVITLEKSNTKENRIVLSCQKVKGEDFTDTILELNKTSRWFSVIGNDTSKKLSSYEKVIDFVISVGNPVKRQDIVNGLAEVMSDKSVDRHLSNALKLEDLIKSEYGSYSAPISPESELPLAE